MKRIQDVPPHIRSLEQERLYEKVTGARAMFYSPYKVWIHSPPVGFGMEMIGTHLNSGNGFLSAAEMEMVALMTARHWNATYVIKNHTNHALRAGLDPQIVAALNSGADLTIRDPRLVALHKFTNVSLSREVPSEAEFDYFVHELTRSGIAEILGAIGYFTSVSLAMNTHAVL